MNSNKRKIIETRVVDNDDSFKHRRSSLRVNLSCTGNLSDSGNGSLKRTEFDCSTLADAAKTSKGLSRSNEMFEKVKHKLPTCKVILEDIYNNECIKNTNCRILRNTILSKTKELFDKNTEVSIKTNMVLGGERDAVQKHEKIQSTTINKFGSSNTIVEEPDKKKKNRTNADISNTPKYKCKRITINESINKGKLRKKRLFLHNDQTENISRYDESLKNITKSPPAHNKNLGSPILAASNKRLTISRDVLKNGRKLFTQNKRGEYGSTCSDNRSIYSISSISEDDSLSAVVPIGYSTMIEESMSLEEKETHFREVDNYAQEVTDMCTRKNVVSMEMTDVRGGFILNNEEHVTENAQEEIFGKSTSYHRSNVQSNSKFDCLTKECMPTPKNANKYVADNVQLSEQSCPLISKKIRTIEIDLISGRMHRSVEITNKQNNGIVENSVNTTRSSLNVNTSIDGTDNDKGSNDKHKENSKNRKLLIFNKENKQQSNAQSTASDVEQDSVDTIHTSLQMNTSTDIANELRLKVTNHKETNSDYTNTEIGKEVTATNAANTCDIHDLENVTLFERLRNISRSDIRNCNSNSSCEKIRNTNTEIEESELTSSATDLSKRNYEKSKCSQSYIEATPYPIHQSGLLKSQLKQNTITQNLCREKNTFTSTINDTNIKKVINGNEANYLRNTSHYHDSANQTADCKKKHKNVCNMIILDESVPQLPVGNTCKTIIIEDSNNEIEHENIENKSVQGIDPKIVIAKKSKKKLLPLHENSQLLSFSPVQENVLSPKQPTFVKRRKKLRRKSTKNHLTGVISGNNTQQTNKKSNKLLSFQNDQDMSCNKKKIQKKPRKVISKKIVIKKIIDKDIMQKLENGTQVSNKSCTDENQSLERRNSLNEFQPKKMLSTKLQKSNLHKIVIVTTGLSMEDKSLVKSVVKALGAAKLELNVTRHTTHIVTTGVRTINLLHGIIRGCWLVSLEWVLKSLEKNEWLNPESYEMVHFSKAVLENRKDRQLFGASYIPELFAACGYIYVATNTKVPCQVLKDLIKTAGGYITENQQIAKIIIGSGGLKESWVLDCITTGELQSHNLYQRT